MKLVWDGEVDAGTRAEQLAADLQLKEPPAGVSLAVNGSHSLVEVETRSYWAFVTWAVTAIMIVFAWVSTNFLLLICAPFMMCGAIMQSWGRVSLLIRDEKIDIFEGIGGVGRRFNVDLSRISRLEFVVKRGRSGSTSWILMQNAGTEVKFGRHLNEEQTRFVVAVVLDAAIKMPGA